MKRFCVFLFSALWFGFMLFVLIRLGFWQLHRYEEKKQILHMYQEASGQEPISFSALQKLKDPRFQRVRLSGDYQTKTILWENQLRDTGSGVDVLTPFMLNNHQAILVDRGWTTLPAHFSMTEHHQEITGYIYVPDSHGFILGDSIIDPASNPLLIQRIEFPALAKVLNLDLFPGVLRLDASEPNGFARQWPLTNLSPEQHLSYAIQWFLMAIALVIAYTFALRKK